jgi:stage IV sporulation protein B
MTERNLTRLRLFSVLLLIVSLILFTGTGLLFNSIPDQIKIFADETKIINLPLKEVTIKVLPETKVIPGGQSVGVRMDVKGVLVVGLEEIQTVDGYKVNPGLEAGLEIGDSILAINNESVDSPEEVKTVVNKQKGQVRLKVRRQLSDGRWLYFNPRPPRGERLQYFKRFKETS